jgi:hypothetical protein
VMRGAFRSGAVELNDDTAEPLRSSSMVEQSHETSASEKNCGATKNYLLLCRAKRHLN